MAETVPSRSSDSGEGIDTLLSHDGKDLEQNHSEAASRLKILKELMQRAEFEGVMDEFTRRLLKAAQGIPLATTLLGHLVQDSLESPESLWHRWSAERMDSTENDADDELSRLNTSIAISINSPRVTSSSRHVLYMLAILPDGLSSSEDRLLGLQDRLPDVSFRHELRSLQRIALITTSTPPLSGRYVVLEPVRHYILQNVQAQEDVRLCLVKEYASIMTNHGDYSSATCRSVVQPELINIRSILSLAFDEGVDAKNIVRAAINYTNWASYHGIHFPDIVQKALSRPSLSPAERVECLLCLGDVQYGQNNFHASKESYQDALRHSKEAQDVAGQAKAHSKIGRNQWQLDDFNGAEQSFRIALKLHTEAQDVVGQANDLPNIGELRKRRDDGAERSLQGVFKFHTEAGRLLGQANNLQSIGNVQMLQADFNEASKSFNEALRVHTEAQNVLGQSRAIALQAIGTLEMQRDELDSAEQSFKVALELHMEAQDELGQANVLQHVGKLEIRKDDLDSAAETFELALWLHTKVQDVLGQGIDLQGIGEIQMLQNKLDDAEQSFQEALRLIGESKSALGLANAHRYLGELLINQGDLERARQFLEKALKTHKQIENFWGQCEDQRLLGCLCIRLENFGSAEEHLKAALSLGERCQAPVERGNVYKTFGELRRAQGRLKDALNEFSIAAEYYKKVQHPRGMREIAKLLPSIRHAVGPEHESYIYLRSYGLLIKD